MRSTVSPFAWWRATESGAVWLLPLLLAVVLLSGGRKSAAQETPTADPRPASPRTSAVSETYRIQPTDILIIDVVNEPKLAGKEFRVSANGEVSYPYIGAVKAADRTPIEVQAEVKRLLEADYLVNAQVLVQVKEFRKRLVQVLGQVARPGLVEIPAERRLSVNEAITIAGGFTRLARTSDIQLTRIGRSEPLRFTAEELRNPDKAVYLEQGDVIFVPESRI